MNGRRVFLMVSVGLCLSSAAHAADIGTALSYSGVLEKPEGTPVTDTCDLRFGLWNAASGGALVVVTPPAENPAERTGVDVVDGEFRTTVDYGAGVFDGQARWLEIETKCTGDPDFILLEPRQEITPLAYALFSTNAPWSGLAGIPAGFADGIDNTGGAGTVTLDQAYDGGGAGAGRVINADAGPVVIENFGGLAVAGAVGIGTLAPTAALDVLGNAHASGTVSSGNSITIDGTNHNVISDNQLDFRVGGSNRALRLEDHASGPNVVGGDVSNAAAAGIFAATIAGGGPSNMVLDNYGFVGGGGNNQASRYGAVAGGISNKASGAYSSVPGGAGNEARGTFSFAVGQQAIANHDGTFVFSTGAAPFISTAPNQFLINATGGVGVGTVSPEDQLHVVNSFPNRIHVQTHCVGPGCFAGFRSRTRDGDFFAGTQADFWEVFDRTANVARLVVRGENVGIGTTAPANKLSVSGGADFAGNVGVGTMAPGADLHVRSDSASTVLVQSTAGGPFASAGITSQTADRAYFAGTVEDQWQVIDFGGFGPARIAVAGGNVGIGTQVPTNQLSVGGTADFTGNVGIGTTTPECQLHLLSDVSRTICVQTTDSGAQSFAGVTSTTGDGEYFAGTSGSGWQVYDNTTLATRLLVDSSGNVGIGTTVPSHKLEVFSSGASSFIEVETDSAASSAGVVSRTPLGLFFTGALADAWLVHAGSATPILSGDASRNVGIGTLPGVHPLVLASGAHCTAGGVWTDASSRDQKENFIPTDARAILDKVAALPIASWNYKSEDDSTRHVGPMAEDFHAIFRAGADDKHLAALDTAGVALAAIQGLYQVVQERDCQIESLDSEISNLKSEIAELKVLMTRLDALQNGGSP